MLRFPTPHDVTVLAFSPDGRLLAVPAGPAVHLHDSYTGRLERVLQSGAGRWGYTRDLVFAADGVRLAVPHSGTFPADPTPGTHVWSVAAGRWLCELPASAVPPAFAPDGKRVLTVGGMSDPGERSPEWCRAWFWDAVKGEPLRPRLHFGRGPLLRPQAVWWPADGPLLVAEAERVRRFDPATGEELGETPVPAGLAVSGGAGTAGGLVLAVERVAGRWLGSRRTGLAVADADGFRPAADFSGRPGSGVWAASPDGRRAVRAEGPVVAAFDLLAGGPAGGLDPGVGPVAAVAVSADGLRLAAGGRRAVAVWDADG